MPELPSFLHRTPEQIKVEQDRQQILHDFHAKGAKQNPAELRIARAMQVEKAIRDNLALIDKHENPEAYEETKKQLAEVLAEQGKYKQAANQLRRIDTDVELEYRRIDAAITRDDKKWCKCVPETDDPSKFVQREVYSEKHNAIVPLVTCSICGFQNAKESFTPPDLSNVEK